MRTRYIAAAILILALALRIGEIERRSYTPIGDARSYLSLGSQIAHTGDYSGRDVGAGNSRGPTAYFPPAYPYFLAAVDLIDGHRTPFGRSVAPARFAQAALGTVLVGLVGLVAVELFGGAVALIALALAAVYPPFIELSSVLVAETLLAVFALAAVWAALRARRSGRPLPWCVAAGVLTGLAALTHDNGVLIVLPLAFALWRAPGPGAETRWLRVRAPLLLLLATVVTLAPWTARNLVVMHHLVPISDETGITLAGTYNPTSAHDPTVPFKWRYYRNIPSDRGLFRIAPTLSEPELSSRLERRALDYIGDHPLALVQAGFDNTLRLLELEGSFAWRASAASIGLDGGTAKIGVVGFWLVCLLAIGGGFTRAARRAPRWPWMVPILFWLSVVFINAETPRFREPIDPFLILLAACALEALGRRVLRRAPVGRRLEPAAPAGRAQLVEVVQGAA